MRTTLDGLTAIRFYAAFWVFLFHFKQRFDFWVPFPVAWIVENGALAMPIFFMLSGLVLGYRYAGKYHGFIEFFRARVARIYPAYLLGVVMCLPFIGSAPGFDLATALFILPVDLLLLQAWYPNLWSFWHHAGTWSISVEFFLYASFPLLLGLNKLTTRALITVCIACTLLAGSWIPSLHVGASSPLPFGVFYVAPIYSLPVFCIGVVLAELYRRGFRGHGAAPFLLLLILGVAGNHNERFAAFNMMTVPLVALTLLFAARYQGEPKIAGLFINRCTIYLGDISYAFFVYQIPLLLALEHHADLAKRVPTGLLFIGLLGTNIALAAFSHHWIEPAARRWIMGGRGGPSANDASVRAS